MASAASIINTASVAAFDGRSGRPLIRLRRVASWLNLALARDLSSVGSGLHYRAWAVRYTAAGIPAGHVKTALGAMVPFSQALGKPAEYALLARQIIENPMLNGEVIRLDGAIRMAPK